LQTHDAFVCSFILFLLLLSFSLISSNDKRKGKLDKEYVVHWFGDKKDNEDAARQHLQAFHAIAFAPKQLETLIWEDVLHINLKITQRLIGKEMNLATNKHNRHVNHSQLKTTVIHLLFKRYRQCFCRVQGELESSCHEKNNTRIKRTA
jgi:hypothetical protein